MTPCHAQKYVPGEDGPLQCDLEQTHLGAHWDPEYGTYFTTHTTDPA